MYKVRVGPERPDGTRLTLLDPIPAPVTLWAVGYDVAQAANYAALAAIQTTLTYPGTMDAVTWLPVVQATARVRLLERMPLNTPFGEQANRVREVVTSLATGQGKSGAIPAGNVKLVIDATGVGAPIGENLRSLRGRYTPRVHWADETGATHFDVNPEHRFVEVLTVLIGSGAEERELPSGHVSVPKRDLINGLVLAMETGRFEVSPHLRFAAALRDELAAMRTNISAAGRESFRPDGKGSAAEGTPQDDLVMALALAYWGAVRRKARPVGEMGPQNGGGRLL